MTDHPSGNKKQLGNVGAHYFDQNVFVHSILFPTKPMEFELTRNDHMADVPDRVFTISACHKQPKDGVQLEAWRILRQISRGRELLP